MSCQGNQSDINQTFIIESLDTGVPVFSACTSLYTNQIISCSGDSQIMMSSGATYFNTDILPSSDTIINIGSPTNRFRSLNSVSGTTTYWTATISINTAMLDLGFDSSGNTRQITADNSIIQNDILLGGNF